VTASHCYSDERLLESKRRRPRYRAEDVMRALALGFILLFVSTVAGAQTPARLAWAATAAGGLLAAVVGNFPYR
jgi:hypothetical protein